MYFRDYPSDGLKITGNYILFDKRHFSVLAEKCGVQIDGILDDMDEYRADDSVFFAELTKSSRPADGIMKYGDTYDFVYLYEDEEPLCHVAAYPRDDGDFTLTEYKNFSGEAWLTLPDFDNYILCVKLHRRDEGQTYEQHRVTVNRGRIDLGDDPVPHHDRYIGFIDGTVTWLWLPVDYIDKETNYSVS